MGLLEVLGLKPSRRRAADGAVAVADAANAADPEGEAPAPTPAPTSAPAAGPAPGPARASGPAPAPQAGDAAREQERARKLIAALTKTYDAHLARANNAVQAQVVPALKARLTQDMDALRTRRSAVDKADPVAGAQLMRALDTDMHQFALRAESQRKEAADGAKWFDDRAAKPFAALDTLFKAQSAGTQSVYQARFNQIKGWLDACQALLDRGEITKLIDSAGRLKNPIDDLAAAVAEHAAQWPIYAALRKQVVDMIQRLRSSGMLDADGLRGLTELDSAVSAADALGPVRGYGAAKAALDAVVGQAKRLRDNNDAYRDFTAERDKVAKGIEALRGHAQAGRLQNELTTLNSHLGEADTLARRADGGALKALTSLKTVAADCAALKTLADKLAAAAAKLPALSKKLEDSGIPKPKLEETARMALKVLLEEGCSEEDAVKMATDASGFRDEGLGEEDAMMSSRVKKSLQDQGLAEEHAKSIGKNIRAAGSSSAADAKALATAMKGVSKKAIDTLTAAGVHSECCRGAVTDAMPDLAGVHPNGWPDTASWDQVPGVYYPDKKAVVVGTIDDGGKRVVPGPGQGPNPHGAADLFGHEAGHAFDAADGGGKSGNAAFLAARRDDMSSGKLKGSRDGGSDDYFLTQAEGGANDLMSTMETFAESFAMHFNGGGRWPKLEDFWKSNPWGI